MKYLHWRICIFNQEHHAEQRRHKEIQPDERICQATQQSLRRTGLFVVVEPEKRPQLFRIFQNFHYSLTYGSYELRALWISDWIWAAKGKKPYLREFDGTRSSFRIKHIEKKTFIIIDLQLPSIPNEYMSQVLFFTKHWDERFSASSINHAQHHTEN